jgi:hypothetical protein
MTAADRLGFWPSLGIVFVCGIVAGFILRIVAVALLASAMATVTVMPIYTTGTAAGTLLAYDAAGIAMTAALVKLGVSLVTSHRIGFAQALIAGIVGSLIGLAPLLFFLSAPATPGSLIGAGLLAFPLGLLALAAHAWLVSTLADA